jgi:hypothetical protein
MRGLVGAVPAAVLTLCVVLASCTPVREEEGPEPSSTERTASARPTTAPTSPSPAPLAEDLQALAQSLALEDIGQLPDTSVDAEGVAGWWDSMYVAVWIADRPITPMGGVLASEQSIGDVETIRYSTEADGPADGFSCHGREYLTGVLGIDDNPSPDHLTPFTEHVVAALC